MADNDRPPHVVAPPADGMDGRVLDLHADEDIHKFACAFGETDWAKRTLAAAGVTEFQVTEALLCPPGKIKERRPDPRTGWGVWTYWTADNG